MSHSVYILQCADDTLYTGYAMDVEARLKEHNGECTAAAKRGAKYTRGRRPVQLVYTEMFDTRSEALKREAAVKKMSRSQKEALINHKPV